MNSARLVVYQLCTIHCWKPEELRAMQEAISDIEEQTESSIIYLDEKKRFKITGSDPKRQQSAMSALSDLLNHSMPAPTAVVLSEVPYGQASRSESHSWTSTPNADHLRGTIITTEDLSAALRAATLNTKENKNAAPESPPEDQDFMRMFRVSDEVKDDVKMYYQEKSQKHDLPTIIAESQGCSAQVSGPGEPRTVTIIGKDRAKVDFCLRQMEEMQAYYLRNPFTKQKVALFYGNPNEIYRVRFQLLSEHPFHATRTTFFPTSANMREPKNYCVATKATYDQVQGVWVISPRRSPPPPIRPAVEISTPVRGQSRSQSPAAQNYGGQGGQGSWQTANTYEVKSSMWSTARSGPSPAASSSRSSPQPWAKAAPPSIARQPSSPRTPSGWSSFPGEEPDASSSSSDWAASSNETSSWANSVTEGLAANPFGTPRAPAIVRSMRQSEWPAPIFDNKADGDFPSLSTAKPRAQKKGMPTLPPVRPVAPDPTVGNLLDFSSSTQAPLPPKTLQGVAATVSNQPLVFGDEDFAFLESKTVQSRPASANSPTTATGQSASVNTLSAPTVRLRDPAKEEEDKRREVRRMTYQQVSPDHTNALKEFIDGERSFNMRRQAESIRACLEELRGQRKEIRLIGRLGQSLFPKDSSLANKVFECSELYRSKTEFSPITTTSLENIESLFGYLGHPIVDTAQYEVYCNSRNNPNVRWTETMITVPSNKAVLDRVVLPWETFGEVTWNGLDRDLDFELLLQAREGISRNLTTALGRTDVKPYKDFQKKLSLGTKNSHITCHDIADYLEVLQIVFRETKQFDRKDGSGCIIVVHRVEELQLTRERELGLCLVKGMTRGRGKTWYEVEVHCEMINKRLKSNLTLTPGLVTDWEAGDLLGDVILNPTDRPVVRMVQNLMELVNECEQKFAY